MIYHFHGPGRHARIDVKCGSEFSRSALARAGPRARSFSSIREADTVAQHDPEPVIPFVVTMTGQMGRQAERLIQNLHSLSGGQIGGGVEATWALPNAATYWHRRIRAFNLAGFAGLLRAVVGVSRSENEPLYHATPEALEEALSLLGAASPCEPTSGPGQANEAAVPSPADVTADACLGQPSAAVAAPSLPVPAAVVGLDALASGGNTCRWCARAVPSECEGLPWHCDAHQALMRQQQQAEQQSWRGWCCCVGPVGGPCAVCGARVPHVSVTGLAGEEWSVCCMDRRLVGS